MPTEQEKEKRKIRFEDLSPSLQARIGNFASKDVIDDLKGAFDNLDKVASDIRVSIGYMVPTDAKEMKEFFVDANYPIIETLAGGAWHADHMVPVGNGARTEITVTIIDSAHQRAHVNVNGTSHTGTFKCHYGDEYTVTIDPDTGYTAGKCTSMPMSGKIIGDCKFEFEDAVQQ